MEKANLSADANKIREIYVKKPFPKGNIAVVEVHLEDGTTFGIGATSRAKSPAPKPEPRSQGGQFEPIIDDFSRRKMDTDAEYKALSAISSTLEFHYNKSVKGRLYLYTERKPCESCQSIIEQFKAKFLNIKIIVFWDYPYPP